MQFEMLRCLRFESLPIESGIPDSVGRLSNPRHLDISNCINLFNLPDDFGNLCNLRNLYMTSCTRCELPYSIINLVNVKVVKCDEETTVSWEGFEAMLPNIQIEVPHVDSTSCHHQQMNHPFCDNLQSLLN
ncbi:putative disease resistance protein, partial [Mucuna pruriens]